jgi:hypothetical protein
MSSVVSMRVLVTWIMADMTYVWWVRIGPVLTAWSTRLGECMWYLQYDIMDIRLLLQTMKTIAIVVYKYTSPFIMH